MMRKVRLWDAIVEDFLVEKRCGNEMNTIHLECNGCNDVNVE